MESAGISTWLNGEALFSGLYLNELLIRLLPAEDPHPPCSIITPPPCWPWPKVVRWSRCCARSNGGCWMTWVTASR
jgi:hypothetical protein